MGKALGSVPTPWNQWGCLARQGVPGLAVKDQTGTPATQEGPGCGPLSLPVWEGGLPPRSWCHWQDRQGCPWGQMDTRSPQASEESGEQISATGAPRHPQESRGKPEQTPQIPRRTVSEFLARGGVAPSSPKATFLVAGERLGGGGGKTGSGLGLTSFWVRGVPCGPRGPQHAICTLSGVPVGHRGLRGLGGLCGELFSAFRLLLAEF